MHQRKASGFTLIELMIVVVIIAVLAAIAYPAYINHTVNTRRAAATACLIELSQFMERYYTTEMSYAGAVLPDTTCQGELAVFYTFSLAAAPTASAYSVQAVPRGQQASRDGAKCGTLTLDQRGTEGVSGSAGVEGCW